MAETRQLSTDDPVLDRNVIVEAVANLRGGREQAAALGLLRDIAPSNVLKALATETSPLSDIAKVDALNLIAVRSFENGLFDTALSYLEHALSIHNGHTDTLFNLGYALHKLARNDLALKFLLRIRRPDAETQNLIKEVRQAGRTGSSSAAQRPAQAPAAKPSPEPVCLPTQPRVTIDPTCDVRGRDRMLFGDGVIVQRDSWLNVAFDNPDVPYMIELGAGTNIGRRCTISASHHIALGKKVLLGPNVLITDHNHEYRHVGIPIVDQGITSTTNQVLVGDGTWIGTNSVIVGNVAIGKGCVIGADTVVSMDIPDYCVAAGNPARVIKAFNPTTGKWASVKTDEEFRRQASERTGLLDHVVPITDLDSLQVEVSSACNLRCPQCFSHIEGHKTAMFSKEMWDERVKPLLPQLKEIHLVGIGEPLLCKDFFRFADDAVSNRVKVHTTSNLQLVTPEMAERLVGTGLSTLSFSCDGVKPETYSSIRVNGTFAKLKESLDLINRFKRERGVDAPKLILNFGALRRNIEELPDVVRFAAENRVAQVIAYQDVIYVPELKGESMFLYQELSDRKFAEAKQLADSLSLPMFMPGLFSKPIKYNPTAGPYCLYPYHHLWLYSDGRVGPCCMDFPDRFVLGDLGVSTIEEVWNSAPMLHLRAQMASEPSYTCRFCVMHGKMDLSDPRYFFRFKGAEMA